MQLPAAAGLATALLLAVCSPPATAAAVGVWSAPPTTLTPEAPSSAHHGAAARRAATLVPRVPAGPWALSLTLLARPGAALRINTADGAAIARLRVLPDGRLAVAAGASPSRVTPRLQGARAWTHRIELVGGRSGRLAVDGTTITVRRADAVRFVAAGSSPARIDALTVTSATRRDALLLHRIGDLEARTPRGAFPIGEGPDGRLRFSGGWTSGFWPGALWRAARLAPDGPYAGWAMTASLDRIGAEGTPIHDLGFMFERSVVAAFQRRCTTPQAVATARCRRLRASGLAAADTLVRLAATSAAGTIPTDAKGPQAKTIVDSLMNLGLLTWATRVSGDPSYLAVAARHARLVRGLLLRADGSTFQVADHDRATGALLHLGTRQGLADDSTWSRGQAWAIYGFAAIGRTLGDAALVRASEEAAGFWVRHAPAGIPPPFDFAAGPGAPRDSSAATIAAAGMYELARACAGVSGACATPGRWRTAAGRTLDDALTAVSTVPPLGRLGEQAYTVGPRNGSWDDRAELVWGLDFALEAVAERALSATGARTS